MLNTQAVGVANDRAGADTYLLSGVDGRCSITSPLADCGWSWSPSFLKATTQFSSLARHPDPALMFSGLSDGRASVAVGAEADFISFSRHTHVHRLRRLTVDIPHIAVHPPTIPQAGVKREMLDNVLRHLSTCLASWVRRGRNGVAVFGDERSLLTGDSGAMRSIGLPLLKDCAMNSQQVASVLRWMRLIDDCHFLLSALRTDPDGLVRFEICTTDGANRWWALLPPATDSWEQHQYSGHSIELSRADFLQTCQLVSLAAGNVTAPLALHISAGAVAEITVTMQGHGECVVRLPVQTTLGATLNIRVPVVPLMRALACTRGGPVALRLTNDKSVLSVTSGGRMHEIEAQIIAHQWEEGAGTAAVFGGT